MLLVKEECERRGSYQGETRIATHLVRQVRPGGGLRLVKAMMPSATMGVEKRERGCVSHVPQDRGPQATTEICAPSRTCYMADVKKRVSRARLRVGEASSIAAAWKSKGLRLPMPIAARLTPRAERCRMARSVLTMVSDAHWPTPQLHGRHQFPRHPGGLLTACRPRIKDVGKGDSPFSCLNPSRGQA